MAERFAAIDVGTNTVLLTVAERRGASLAPLVERAEITRLGRGVDATGRLDPGGIRDTVAVLAAYAGEARALGAEIVACVATSAARDAGNGAEFFEAARRAAGLAPEVISGDEEARLVYASAWRDFGGAGPLAVLDVGGGSTEFTVGDGPAPRARTSLQVGAVRLTERHVRGDPTTAAEVGALRRAAREALQPIATMAPPPGQARLVGVAGTVTTLAAVEQALPAYDAERVHGATLTLASADALVARLAALTVRERAALPGMEPKRADVILAGAIVVVEALRTAGFDRLIVSDRGVRWGLLHDRVPQR
ncbi:Ppx/GppA phosphatase family protein [Anaeromyxobacter sp. Fw109-5]|uniref:Ppx/GppA phosphatase family protein n=1 Tax=Anaeromyxobacter sp. (strain Fw109-5) TaxID=404589 RepID=UPI0000ED7966|nr:Ppx/GppA phosphatase family protein [Anaeromyxobacter sp. Fw109-5]ABS24915.1 Ppx/GppA phosphatase [Anaeromyxobacter sp. Fw109-5]